MDKWESRGYRQVQSEDAVRRQGEGGPYRTTRGPGHALVTLRNPQPREHTPAVSRAACAMLLRRPRQENAGLEVRNAR